MQQTDIESLVLDIMLPELPPFKMRVHAAFDGVISRRIARHGVWEPFETQVVREILRDLDAFVDVGANIGWYSLVAGLTLRGRGRVIAFEPDPTNFALLARNVAENRLGGHVRLHHAALADAPGQRLLFRSPDNFGAHRLYSVEAERQAAVPVAVTTFDAAAARHIVGPCLVKMDTEGSEAMILAGMRDHLAAHARDTALLFEFSPVGLSNSGSSAAALAAMLEPLGMRAWLVDERHSGGLQPTTLAGLVALAEDKTWRKTPGYANVLMIPPGHPAEAAIAALETASRAGRGMMRGLLARLVARIRTAFVEPLRADIARLQIRLARAEAEAAAAARLLAHQAEEAVFAAPRYGDPLRLSAQRGQTFSQFHEDGAIAAIFARIGTESRVFVEIGAGDGSENTTRALLETGWEGVWVEADSYKAAIIRDTLTHHIASGRLVLVEAAATAENVTGLVAGALNGRKVDLLSIGEDINTSHLWRALDLAPRACCIEYNASIPAPVAWEIPYDPDARWDGTARFGASLKVLEAIGRAKGMSLVGCDAAGVNAFFVRADLAPGRFPEPFNAETHWEPPRYYLAFRRGHPTAL